MSSRGPVGGGELEEALAHLARELAYPATPNLAGRVRAQVDRQPRTGGHRFSLWSARRAVLGGFATVLLALSGLLALPGPRHALASWLHLKGLEIQIGGSAPLPLGHNLSLGRQMTLQQARQAATFSVALPSLRGLHRPDEVYVATGSSGTRVTFLYRARPGLPAATQTGAGLLLTEFEARTDEGLLHKTMLTGGQVSYVSLQGQPGYWLHGRPHLLFYFGPNNTILQDTVRLAGDTLIWQRNTVTLRLEGKMRRSRALAIARSVRTP